MSTSKRVLTFRRKRQGLTNYKKRLRLLLSHKPRLVVRRSLKNINAQIVEYNQKGDKILVTANSKNLEKFGWKANKGNLPSSYLIGLFIGKKAKEKGIKEVVLDIGLHKSIKGSRIYALLKGVLDSGIIVPCSKDILPSEERIKGGHIAKYASELKKSPEEYKKRFNYYLKNDIDPALIGKYFDETKNKILGA